MKIHPLPGIHRFAPASLALLLLATAPPAARADPPAAAAPPALQSTVHPPRTFLATLRRWRRGRAAQDGPGDRASASASEPARATVPAAFAGPQVNAASLSPSPSDLADTTTIRPGSSSAFTGFQNAAVSGVAIAFADFNSSLFAGNGIYTGIAGSQVLSRLADTSTTDPSGGGAFYGFDSPALSGTRVAFYAGNSSSTGIYTGSVGSTSVASVADTNLTVPGLGGTFHDFGDPAISGTNVVFASFDPSGNPTGLYSGTVGIYGATRLGGHEHQRTRPARNLHGLRRNPRRRLHL